MQTISRDGTSIAYHATGRGPAVILLDGALCARNVGPMAGLVPLLSDQFTVYHYDRRGRNQSSDAATYSMKNEIEDLQAIITAAGGSAMVFGMSSGAVLAIHAAAESLGITKVALYEPPFQTTSEGKADQLRKIETLKDLLKQNRRSEAVRFFQVDLVGIPKFVPFILRMTPLWKKLTEVAPTLAYDFAILGDGALPMESLAKIRVPTAIIGGEKSPDFLRNAVQATAEAKPEAELILLPKQTHDFSAKRLAPVLREFFSRA